MASLKDNKTCTPIPGPPGWPVIGNILDIDLNASLKSLGDLAEQYGEIFQLSLGGNTHVFVTNVALLNEICDESRFHKQVVMAIEQLRNGAHDGLFTARDGEHNWDLAHRILLPVLGPTKIRNMLASMQDIGEQLRLKWERYGPTHPIDVSSDFTRLTLDTLALCTMNYRFNSFYRDDSVHRFVSLMTEWLRESDNQASLPSVINDLRFITKKKLKVKIEEMRKICRDIIESRRRHPDTTDDLLNAMLQKTDPATGESLSEESVIDNIITFLVAGHETTSGLLSFTLYFLVSHPLAFEKAQKEIDAVVGTGPVTINHLPQLKYLNAVLRETLRMMPTAPAFVVGPYNDELIADKYPVPKGLPIWALLTTIHRDPNVYGLDSNEWKPERMLDENFNKLPPNSWKPFGNGKRGCIGRAFAWQESLLTMALLLQRFTFSMVNKDYDLQIKETLTIKPDKFQVFAKPRDCDGHPHITNQQSTLDIGLSRDYKTEISVTQDGNNKPVSIFYGSNSGTCETLAWRLAENAKRRHFDVVNVEPLDSATNNIPSLHLVLILTSSYDGNPPDNAKRFFDWLMSQKESMSSEVSYAVFGCGHHDWISTFMKVPTSIDKQLQHLGCHKLVPLGQADTADEDAFSALTDWEDNLWKAAGCPSESISSQSQCTYKLLPPLRTGYVDAVVTKVDHLSNPGVTVKAHLEVQLPPGVKYSTGDNLSVLPYNSRYIVQRALARFQLSADSLVTVESSNADVVIPYRFPLSVAEVFTTYVELSLPASQKNIQRLAEIASDREVKDALLVLATSAFLDKVTAKRLSVLAVLEQYPSISLSVTEFLSMLAPMRPRLYSISSSPTWKPSNASITWSVIDAPARSGLGNFQGVASNYLLDLSPGSILRVSIKNSNAQFRPPVDMATSPVVMIASGSGLGPFRAFLQERELNRRGKKPLARALLFFGCRGPDKDDLYRNEFDEFERNGIVRIVRAYSTNPGHPEARGCRHIQEALLLERTEVTQLWNVGAFIYVCGGLQMVKEVKEKLECVLHGQSGSSAFTPEDSARIVIEAFT